MKMLTQKIANQLIARPRQVFLLDGIGAVISAFFLGIVLVYFEAYIGLSKEKLYVLAGLPTIFAVYSLYCYFNFPKKNWRKFLKIIAIANITYTTITSILIISLFEQLTILGVLYFVLEIIILLILIQIEWETIYTEDK